MSFTAFADKYVSDRVRPFLFLSHPADNSPPAISQYWTRYYTSGFDDIYLLIGWGAVLVALRAVLLVVFKNFARRWLPANAPSPPAPDKKDHTLGNGVYQANGVASAVASNGHADGNGDTSTRSRVGNGNGKLRENSELDFAAESRRTRAERVAKKAVAARERVATRFAEQGAVCVYYLIAWFFGLVRTSAFLWYSCVVDKPCSG